MKLVVGLGNIGQEYDLTRHNIGFAMLDEFALRQEFESWKEKPKFIGFTTKKDDTVLLKPSTFMNKSGDSAVRVATFFNIPPEDVIIVHDDKDLPFGDVRIKVGGGSAGHNGIKSLPASMQEKSTRIRIGVANEITAVADTSDFVLGKFTKPELEEIQSNTTKQIIDRINKLIEEN